MLNLKTNIQETPPCALDIDINKNIAPVSFLLIRDFFTSEECDFVTNYVQTNKDLILGQNREGNVTYNRSSYIAFLEHEPLLAPIVEKIKGSVLAVNKKYQRFELTHLDRLQYTTYKKDQYLEYHNDDYFDYLQLNGENRDLLLRKLSISVGLNEDYEGGELEFKNLPIKIKPKPGMLAVIPGGELYSHRVNKVLGPNSRHTLYGNSFIDIETAPVSTADDC